MLRATKSQLSPRVPLLVLRRLLDVDGFLVVGQGLPSLSDDLRHFSDPVQIQWLLCDYQLPGM